uniref:Uncharacterized protein n=1 Tax=Panagrolaimus superbus TaxID=310955 RepID=A0A914YGV8_9BILA
MSIAFSKAAVELSSLDDEKLQESLNKKELDFYQNCKNLPDSIARRFHEINLLPRWEEAEKRVKVIEDRMTKMECPDGSVSEDRFEILAELLDKACQAFEIWDEHKERKIPYGHRLVLEGRLLESIKDGFDLIESTIDDFNRIGDDRDAANIERQDIRLEIRLRDLMFTEVHERFLKSYLEMDW